MGAGTSETESGRVLETRDLRFATSAMTTSNQTVKSVTADGVSTWQSHLSDTPRWTCDCGHENARWRGACIECGLAVTERGIEQ